MKMRRRRTPAPGIWAPQRLQRDRLQTAMADPPVLHPGFVSVEGGPDFRGASFNR